MAGNRRIGDWQNRDHDEANTLVGASTKKWHQQTFWIIVFLLVFWPVGLVFTWKSDWHVVFKVLATVLVVGVSILWYSMTQAALQAQSAMPAGTF